MSCAAPGRNGGAKPRVSSPTCGRSTFVTSAPKSPSTWVQEGPRDTDQLEVIFFTGAFCGFYDEDVLRAPASCPALALLATGQCSLFRDRLLACACQWTGSAGEEPEPPPHRCHCLLPASGRVVIYQGFVMQSLPAGPSNELRTPHRSLRCVQMHPVVPKLCDLRRAWIYCDNEECWRAMLKQEPQHGRQVQGPSTQKLQLSSPRVYHGPCKPTL